MTTESNQAQDASNVPTDRHSGQQDVPFPPAKPASPADDQKGREPADASSDVEQAAEPATGADDQKPEANAEAAEKQRLSRRQRKYERERDARVRAETERDLLRAQLSEAKQQPAVDADPEPKREGFEDYETFLRASAKWEARQEFKSQVKAKGPEQSQQQPSPQQPDTQTQKFVQDWERAEKELQKTAPDYVEVVTEYLEDSRLSPHARDAIREAGPEIGPKILYHLASNAEDAARIEKLSPARQAAELVKLEEKFTKPAARRESAAPPPVGQTRQGSSSNSSGYRDNMTTAEYREWRKGQGARWAH